MSISDRELKGFWAFDYNVMHQAYAKKKKEKNL